ncbi:MAG: mannitol dehydrogenase family protein [Lachnospiraceae bacterium]|jgi:fructuronate reductase|nr:mannitol dehydrogenase family protein [Lachnospiraceae bacterium]MCI1398752.1 mannitol dehydrogenase family protein [Lachnospiraceae bacterium]MCI1423852.1 mannitol dehydrogenase family protein [Lachnospiraceae bacterium]MCI1452296.1 mannitol dehydrogenase family protein [Lachnospiraceae bacterium]
MKLSVKGLENAAEWTEKGYALPKFDREAMIAKTVKNPTWVHFGAGNIFRAFHANLAQRMLDEGASDTGITVAEGFDYEIIEKQYRPHDNLSVLVTLKADGNIEKTVIGSIAESCILDSENAAEYGRLKEIFSSDSLQLCTFTVTEKGYSLVNGRGEQLPTVTADFAAGPEKPASYMGKVVSLLYTRYLAGKKPIAMVSTDNCSHNGEKLFGAVMAFANAWIANGLAEKGFADYLQDETKVSFPWSMIDKITPRPDASVEQILAKDGLEDLEPVITSKKTYVAPFVNAEETEYLVVEDKFPNGRPALEKVGVIFTDRDTVNKVERMKVTTCLNPLHTALAVYGCLLGYTKISDEMKDEDLVKLVRTIGYKEGLPVVVNPGVLDPKEFIDTVVNVRIPNPFMPDTPQRIATDTSQKLSIRYGETIKSYLADSKLDVMDLKLIPLVQAGWLRYLMAVDDNGAAFEPSPDPLLADCQKYVKDFSLGQKVSKEEARKALLPLLKNAQIFGVDLEQAGLADRVAGYFTELIDGAGAVRRTLHKYVND